METIEELQETLRKLRLVIESLIKQGIYMEETIKEALTEQETIIAGKIIKLESGRSPDTKIIVKFPDNNKVFDAPDSKENYLKSVVEFGIENVYINFPQYFLEQEDRTTDIVKVAPNRYLKVGLNNFAKKRNLKAIGEKLDRTILVFFELR